MSPGWLIASVVAVLIAAPTADAAVRSRLDKDAGVRLTLDGRQLTATIVEQPNYTRDPSIERDLYGRVVTAACGTRFRRGTGKVVFRRRRWPEGARSFVFEFERDVSRGVRWCLIEARDGGDVAVVSFQRAEPSRLVAKGRGPSGRWWRLSAWRSDRLEPCVRLTTAEGVASSRCFADAAELEARLASVIDVSGCPGDTFVYGATARSTRRVTVVLADGSSVDATLHPRPRASRVRAQYYIAVLPGIADVRRVEAVDAEGRVIETNRYSEEPLEDPCGVVPPG